MYANSGQTILSINYSLCEIWFMQEKKIIVIASSIDKQESGEYVLGRSLEENIGDNTIIDESLCSTMSIDRNRRTK